MEDTIMVIKKILVLLLLLSLSSCNTSKLPVVSSKLESVFKEHKKIYKKQKVWKDVQWEYKHGRKIVDSLFNYYNLNESEDFYILSYTNDLSNLSIEVKSIDKKIHLKFNNGYKKLELLPDYVKMTYFDGLLYYTDFINFIDNKTQGELSNCGRQEPIVNKQMVLFTHYDKGNITVKRFVTCDYAKYFNLQRHKEEDWD